MAEEEPFNYLTIENRVNIHQYSSQVANCPCSNILISDRKSIWLSDKGLPQYFVLDLSHQLKRPKLYKCFGFDCWHDYSSNPSTIELWVSTDGEKYITWTVLHADMKAGVQLFPIDPLGVRYNFLKVVIKETFGAAKTYINQVFLFEENPLNRFRSARGEPESLNNSDFLGEKKMDEPIRGPIKHTPSSTRKGDNPPKQRDSSLKRENYSMPKLPSSHPHPNYHSEGGDHSYTQRPGSQIRHNVIHDHQRDQNVDESEPMIQNPPSWQVSPSRAGFVSNSTHSSKPPTSQHQFAALTEQINSASKEVHKLAHQKNVRIEEDKSEEEEISQMPLLTHSEKEVLKLKKEMKQLSGAVNKIQENMTVLMEKMTHIGSHFGGDSAKDKLEGRATTEGRHTAKSTALPEFMITGQSSTNPNPLDNPIVNEYMESLKVKIGGFLESLHSQNEAILEENRRLRQHIEAIAYTQGKGENFKTFSDSPKAPSTYEIEKTVSNIFEKNMKEIEHNLVKHIKQHTEQAEDRIFNRVHTTVENVRSSEENFKGKIEDELRRLRGKVEFLEHNRAKLNDITQYYSDEAGPLTSKEYLLICLFNIQRLKREVVRDVLKTNRPKYQPFKDEFVKGDENSGSLNKIQYLMERLQEKIALREKKVQALQNDTSDTGDNAERGDFDDSKYYQV